MATLEGYNQFNIPTVNFAGTVFKPQELKFEAPDSNITQRALAVYEDRQNRLLDKKETVANKLETIRNQFGDDAETQQWFDDNAANIDNAISERAAAGDYHGATEAAVNGLNSFINNSETTARKNQWAEYNKEAEKIKTDKTLDATTIERWIAANPFKTDLLRDENGKVIGFNHFVPSTEFSDSGMPVADIDWKAGLSEVIGFATEKKTTTSNSNTNDVDNYQGGQFGSFTASSNGLTVTTERGTVVLSYDKLHDNLVEWVNRNQEGLLQYKKNLEFRENKLRTELEKTTDENKRADLEKRLEYYNQFHDVYGSYLNTDNLTIAEAMMDDTLKNAAKFDETSGKVFKRSVGKKNAPKSLSAIQEYNNNNTKPVSTEGAGASGPGSVSYKDQAPSDGVISDKNVPVPKVDDPNALYDLLNTTLPYTRQK